MSNTLIKVLNVMSKHWKYSMEGVKCYKDLTERERNLMTKDEFELVCEVLGIKIKDKKSRKITCESKNLTIINEPTMSGLQVIFDKQYFCKQFGNKIWMMENLGIDPKFINLKPESNTMYNKDKDEWYYTWNDAMKISEYLKGSGWHLPSAEEWNQLAIELDGVDTMEYHNPVHKDYMFKDDIIPKLDIKLLGYYDGSFGGLGSYSYFWTSTEYNSSNAYNRRLDTGASLNSYSLNKSYGLSIRLVKDS